MKFLAFIIIAMLVLAQFLKADTIQTSEPELLTSKPNGYNIYVSCIDGYKYMFYRDTVVQMFIKLHTTAVPISCK